MTMLWFAASTLILVDALLIRNGELKLPFLSVVWGYLLGMFLLGMWTLARRDTKNSLDR